MKFIYIIAILITLIACQSSSTSKETEQPESESWTVNLRSVSSHTYTSKGFLDKTYGTTYTYVQGQLLDSTKSITKRVYDDHQNLIREKEAEIRNDNSVIPISEVVYKYDSKNNLIERASYYGKRLVSKRKEVYDQHNRNTQTVLIQSLTNPYLLENVSQRLLYDTTYQVMQLDAQGNVIKITSRDKTGRLKSMVFKTYDQRRLIAFYSINAAGQTTVRQEVTKERNLEKATTYFMGESPYTDISWQKNGKIIKSITRYSNPDSKSKWEHSYNEKGDEVESISYY